MQPIYLYRNMDEKHDAVRVDRFPDFPKPVRTISLHTHNFYGTVTVEASIVLEPTTEDDWVAVWTEEFGPRFTDMPSVRNRAKNVVGHFKWMRVTVETITGHVDRVLVI